MARWVSADALRVQDLGLSDAVKQGIEGYRFGQEQKNIQDQKELGSLMAGIPEAVVSDTSTDSYEDTAQSNMLRARQKYNPVADPSASGAQALEAIPADSYVSNADVQNEQIKTTETKTTTSKDWKAWEDGIRKKAGAMGPEALQAANAHITKTKQDALRENASTAMLAYQNGDTRSAMLALQEAYTSFPDGNRAEIDMVGGEMVAKIYDEETGELLETRPVGIQDIAAIVQLSEDPVAYAEALTAAESAQAAADLEERKVVVDEKNLDLLEQKEENVMDRFKISEKRLSAKDADSMSIAERNAAVAEGRAEVDKLRSGVMNKGTEATIRNIEANIEELDKASGRADDQLVVDKARQALAEKKQSLEGLKNAQDAPNRALQNKKLEAEIKVLEANEKYILGGKGSGSETYIKQMKLKDLVKAITDIQTTIQEAKFLASDDKATETDKQAYQNLLILQQRLYDEEASRSNPLGSGQAGSTDTRTVDPVKVNSVEEARALPKGTKFITPTGRTGTT